MKNYNEDSDPSESHRRNHGYSQSRILEIERAERAEFLTLLQQVERLYDSRSRRIDEIRKRMGFSVHQDTLTSPQTTASPILKDDKRVPTSRTNQTLVEEVPFYKKRLCLGSKMAGGNTANKRNPRTDASLSYGDMPTPTEPRAISQFSLFTPSPPSSPPARATRRRSRLPVITTKFGGAVKEVADGCKLQSSQTTLEGFMETLERFEFRHHPSPEPPTAPSRIPKLASRFTARPSKAVQSNNTIPHRGTLAMAPKVPAPPLEAAPPNRSGRHHGTPAVAPRVPAPPSEAAPAQRKGPRRGTLVVAPKFPAPPSEAAPAQRKGPRRETLVVAPKFPAPPSEADPPNKKGPRHGTKCHPNEDLPPLVNPTKSLSLCLTQLVSDNWKENMDGLKSVRALARHHPEHLQTKLHEVCLVLTEAVKNLRSAVACSAMSTLAELHTHLGRAMDNEAQWTGCVLLLKLAQTTNTFIHQQANLALDALVEGCSPSRVISVLLNTGLSHRCAAVRGCTAKHLHQLADIIGEEQILTAGKTFTKSFLIAVSKMVVDASPDVRHYGQKMLKGLAHQKEFEAHWDRTIPVEDRRPLDKILKKMGQ